MDRDLQEDAVTAAVAYVVGILLLTVLLRGWRAVNEPFRGGTDAGYILLSAYPAALTGMVVSGVAVFAAGFWLRGRIRARWLVAGVGVGITHHAITRAWWLLQGVTGAEAAQYAAIFGTGLYPAIATGVVAHILDRTGLPGRIVARMDQHT